MVCISKSNVRKSNGITILMVHPSSHTMIASPIENTVVKAIGGDQQAIAGLVDVWYKRIYNVGYKYFADHNLAMEVTQKTFITLSNKITDLKNPNGFKSWLYRIAINNCHEEERRNKRFQRMHNGQEEQWDAVLSVGSNAKEDPERAFQQSEIMEVISKALLKIPNEQKVVVIMKEYEGMKFKEIAEVIGESENTIKSRLYYGLKSLRKILTNMGVNLDSFYHEL